MNHFDSTYFGNGLRWHLPMVERMARGFFRARETYRASGRNIINTTPNSMLDIFERAPFGLAASEASQCSTGGVTKKGAGKNAKVAVGVCVEKLPLSKSEQERYTQLLGDLSLQSTPDAMEIHLVVGSTTKKSIKTSPFLSHLCQEVGRCTYHLLTEPLSSFRCQSTVLESTGASIYIIAQAGTRVGPTWLHGIVQGFARDSTCWSMRGSVKKITKDDVNISWEHGIRHMMEKKALSRELDEIEKIRKRNYLSRDINLCSADRNVPYHGR